MSYNDIYMFQFQSVRRYSPSGMPYKVYSENLDDINTFIRQHNFDPVAAKDAISVHPRSELNVIDSYSLKPYKFMSNFRYGEFTIMTTEYFTDIIIENLSSDLVQTLMFGESIFRTDLEVFKTIIECMDVLHHANIVDFALVDTEDTKLDTLALDKCKLAQEIVNLNKQYCARVGCPTEDGPIQMIQDDLSMDMLNDDIAPITLEGYISGFTELMLDVFN